MNRYILIIICSILSLPAFSQDDFGLDFELGLEKKLATGLKLELEGGVRTQDNTRRIDRYSLGAGLSYKFWSTPDKKWSAKAFGNFEYLWVQSLSKNVLKEKFIIDDDGKEIHEFNHTDRYWRKRYRSSLGLTLNFALNKRWLFQLKETFQHNHYCNVDSVSKTKWRFNDDDELYLDKTENDFKRAKDRLMLRNKFTVTYDIPMCKFDPFASVEYTAGLNYSTTKWKYTVGTDYKLSKTKKLSVFYRYNHEDDDDEPNGHLIGFSYNIDF